MELRQLIRKRSGNKLLYRLKMDMMFEAYLSHDSDRLESDDIPQTDEPVWILGKKYSSVEDIELIRNDIKSRLWFTYRKNFIPIGDSGKTSDKGWGCMLRCGQMLLGQALLNNHLGRDWLWNVASIEEKYLKILKMFEDRKSATYSIHQIALMGASEGKQVGDWFGPNTVAQVIKKLSQYDDWSNIAVHVALDNTIILSEIRSIQRMRWKPLVLIVPLRLGINEINSIYMQGLKACFTFPQSLGAIGGKPNHALYFIGTVGNDVIFLDPHVTQISGSVHNNKPTEQDRKMDSSYHCPQASRLHILHMDPSIAVGFFCKTIEDFDILIKSIRETIALEKQPLFEIRDESHVPWAEKGQEATSLSNAQRHHNDSDEDFEIIE